MTDFAHNKTAETNRTVKATALCDFMLDTRFVRAPEPDEYRRVERGADIGRCSDETWSLALRMWRDRR